MMFAVSSLAPLAIVVAYATLITFRRDLCTVSNETLFKSRILLLDICFHRSINQRMYQFYGQTHC